MVFESSRCIRKLSETVQGVGGESGRESVRDKLMVLAQTSGTMSVKRRSFRHPSKPRLKVCARAKRIKFRVKMARTRWGDCQTAREIVAEEQEIESVVAKLAERVVAAAAAAAEMSGSTNSKSNNSKEVSSAMWALATMHVDGIILSAGHRRPQNLLQNHPMG